MATPSITIHLSPEMHRRLPQHHLTPLEAQDPRGFLSASLPSQMAEGDIKIPDDSRNSSTIPTSPSRSLTVRQNHRPRSASLFSSGGSIRRSLRLRSRPSSGRGSRRSKSQDSIGPDASTEYIDNTLARIKQQLAQFTEEDQTFKERIDKLNEQINELRNTHKNAVQLHHSTSHPRLRMPHRRSMSLDAFDRQQLSSLSEDEFPITELLESPSYGKSITLPRNFSSKAIPILKFSSSKGELLVPVEETLDSDERRGGGSKLSSITSRSDTDTPEGGLRSAATSKSSSTCSSVAPDDEIAEGSDKEAETTTYAHSPSSGVEDDVFFKL